MLSIKNYSKSYNGKEVLSFPEHSFEKGIYLVQGINGSGKTTLFKSVSGIIKFKGDCTINDVNLKNNPIDYRRLINYCEAEPLFPGFLTGMELISFTAKAKNSSEGEVNSLSEVFGIKEFWNNPISTYSSGMLKKTALTMAFCGSPKIILLDEPFTTIDQETTKRLCGLINDYNTKGCTFIISAHQIKETIAIDFDDTVLVSERTLKSI